MLKRLGFISCLFGVNKILLWIPAFIALQGHAGLKTLLVANWTRWDALLFERIASHGYTLRLSAFFPLYPYLMRYVHMATGFSRPLSGVVLSNLCYFLLLFALYEFLRLDYGHSETRKMMWIFAVFPMSWYFSSAYSESLFMLLAVLAFIAMRRKKWAFSGGLGFFTGLTRNMGAFLAIPYFIEVLDIERWSDFRHLRTIHKAQLKRLIPILLFPLGTITFMVYCAIRLHNPLAFSDAEHTGWGRQFHNPVWTIVYGTYDMVHRNLVLHPDFQWHWFYYTITSLIWVFALLFIIFASVKKMRVSYWVFLLISFLVPLIYPDCRGHDYFMSIQRLMTVVPPLYIAIYELFGNKRWSWMVVIVLFALALMIYVYVWTKKWGFIA